MCLLALEELTFVLFYIVSIPRGFGSVGLRRLGGSRLTLRGHTAGNHVSSGPVCNYW